MAIRNRLLLADTALLIIDSPEPEASPFSEIGLGVEINEML